MMEGDERLRKSRAELSLCPAAAFCYKCRMPRKDEIAAEKGLHHQLHAGQMAMVAVGGSIGTGLLLGSAPAMHLAGPAVILSFAFAAFVSWTAAMALGELSSAHPAAGSFGVYGDMYLNDWAGFIARAGYWAAIAISIGAELVASATYMAFWFHGVPALVWVVIFSVFLLLVNLWDVGRYGRFEFWFAMIKVVTIAAFVVLGAGLLASGHVSAQYTTQGGFFPSGVHHVCDADADLHGCHHCACGRDAMDPGWRDGKPIRKCISLGEDSRCSASDEFRGLNRGAVGRKCGFLYFLPNVVFYGAYGMGACAIGKP